MLLDCILHANQMTYVSDSALLLVSLVMLVATT